MPDACIDVRCGEGEVCQPSSGDCIPDSCAQIRCPEGYICELTLDDQAACFLPEQGGYLVTAAGGGCACNSSTGTPGAGLLLFTYLARLTEGIVVPLEPHLRQRPDPVTDAAGLYWADAPIAAAGTHRYVHVLGGGERDDEVTGKQIPRGRK